MLRLAKIDVINNRGKEAMDRFKFCIENLERKISVQDVYSEPDSPAYERYNVLKFIYDIPANKRYNPSRYI